MFEDVKKLLGFPEDEDGQDGRIHTILSLTSARLKHLLGGADAVPECLAYIVTEVSVSRFNRIGSEGLSSHAVEGETMSWGDDDFAPYMADIESYISGQKSLRRGRVRFL